MTAQAQQQEKLCTHLVFYDKATPSQKQIKEAFEKGNDKEKYDALKDVIMMQMNGENQNKLLMHIIRFVLPTTNKQLKKLLLYYFEIIERTGKENKLLPEMILVCSHLRNDLIHPNEYIRGCVLRFLCKIKEQDLIEPLIGPILSNLEHRHSYVRRNAVLAVYSIYKSFPHLMPDAPEQIEQFLQTETDVSSKRNAFLMLFDCAQDRAVKYLRSIIDQVSSSGDVFQLVLLNLLRKMCKTNPSEKSKYLRVISSLMESKTNAVVYQCAGTLFAVSASSAAIKAAASCYIRLLLSHTDNNIKLIVLDRLVELKNKFPTVMQQMVLDLMRVLSSPEIEYKKRVLEICMDLVSSRNIDSIISVLKKEIQKSQEAQETDKNEAEYRKLLVQAIHKSAVKYPEIASHVLMVMDLLGDSCGADVMLFVRDMVEHSEKIRSTIIEKLAANLEQINTARVFRIALWILGDYYDNADQICNSFNALKNALGDLTVSSSADQTVTDVKPVATSSEKDDEKVKVHADGTYATQVAESPQTKSAKLDSKPVNLRTILLDGNYYLGSVVCSSLTKLVVAYRNIKIVSDSEKNVMTAEAVNIMVGILKLGIVNEKPSFQMDTDTFERITLCIRLLTQNYTIVDQMVAKDYKDAFANIVKEKKDKHQQEQEAAQKERLNTAQADTLLTISQLKGKQFLDAFDFEEEDVEKATSNDLKGKKSSRLSRVTQLTGFSDPVYAEATVAIHQYDIVLDVFVMNQTSDTLQNLTVELSTVGDLKLCERPQSYTLAPYSSQRIKATIKVSSTETGIIFGNIVYDVSSATDSYCIVLNDVHIDIMDYIAPANCDDIKFRTMWFEFEWENKIPVAKSDGTLREFLSQICGLANMACMTPESALEGDCEFLSANLYARSTFGEDALANVSLEKMASGKMEGFVRIRSKTQGIALSLGNIITNHQKQAESKQKKAVQQ